jgi:phage protein U
MLMGLGQFVFDMGTLPFQELQRKTTWKHRANSRVNARDVRQFVGPGDDTFTIVGVLVPELTGASSSLDELRKMADTGEAYALVDGTGAVYGAYLIEDLDTTSTNFRVDGTARRIGFSIELTRQDDDRASSMAQKGAS